MLHITALSKKIIRDFATQLIPNQNLELKNVFSIINVYMPKCTAVHVTVFK